MPSRFDRLFATTGMPTLLHQFGIPALYAPKARANQSPREIYVLCSYDRPASLENETTESEYERLWVTVWRDAVRGIDAPEQGDSLRRVEFGFGGLPLVVPGGGPQRIADRLGVVVRPRQAETLRPKNE